jgi:hypothetical protein
MSNVVTGRTTARPKAARCPGCDARKQYGEPNPNDSWAAGLSLTEKQVDLLLVAAAEFDAFSDECRFCNHVHLDGPCIEIDPGPTPTDDPVTCECKVYVPRPPAPMVDFIDWVSVDALRPKHYQVPEFDGRKPSVDDANAYRARFHRHPDPLPMVPMKLRKLVS